MDEFWKSPKYGALGGIERLSKHWEDPLGIKELRRSMKALSDPFGLEGLQKDFGGLSDYRALGMGSDIKALAGIRTIMSDIEMFGRDLQRDFGGKGLLGSMGIDAKVEDSFKSVIGPRDILKSFVPDVPKAFAFDTVAKLLGPPDDALRSMKLAGATPLWDPGIADIFGKNIRAVEAIARTLRGISAEDFASDLDELASAYDSPDLSPEERTKKAQEWFRTIWNRISDPRLQLLVVTIFALIGHADSLASWYERLANWDERAWAEFERRRIEATNSALHASEAEESRAAADRDQELQIVLRTCVQLVEPDHISYLRSHATLKTRRRGHAFGELNPGTDVVVLCIAGRDVYVQAEYGGRLVTGWVRKKALSRPRVPLQWRIEQQRDLEEFYE